MYMLYDYLGNRLLPLAFFLFIALLVSAQEKETSSYKIFQVPADKIPSTDGKKTDWDIVPDSFAIGTDQLVNDNPHFPTPDYQNPDVSMPVNLLPIQELVKENV